VRYRSLSTGPYLPRPPLPRFFVSVDSKGSLSLAESAFIEVVILKDLEVNIIPAFVGQIDLRASAVLPPKDEHGCPVPLQVMTGRGGGFLG
jgi:hypothetical protein